jgi:glycosyltransferase involved in cell wall biosynthesis
MNHKLIYTSSYDRGLVNLLVNWQMIKDNYPDAELHICYGWDLFDIAYSNNPERMKWKQDMIELMKQPGITEHGRLGKDELQKLRKECTFWVYPATFSEINCISALEAQRDGLIPVTVPLAALDETVQSGVKVTADISKPEGMQTYLIELFSLMDNPERVRKERKKAKKHAEKYTIDKISEQWTKAFAAEKDRPLLTVYTPTIRSGWWNLMAHALSKQTYKNFEWIIVDDFPEDRKHLADKYSNKYKLNIRYIRGEKHCRKYSLVRANNIAMREANGELLVFLQDFVIPPIDGLEKIVNIYLRHPNDLIAPVDIAFMPTQAPDFTKEDWFSGSTDIKGEIVYRNIRMKARVNNSVNPFDFEQNYGAIPVSLVRELNGWWEALDDGLGFDNTDIAMRAIKLGSVIQLDITNVAECLHHQSLLKDKEPFLPEARAYNESRYEKLFTLTEKGELPLVRDENIDASLDLSHVG